MKKEEAMERLNLIASKSTELSGRNYTYSAYAKDWEKNGKNRTYFKIYEHSPNPRHTCKICDYGYVDNLTEQYVAGISDLTKNYTVSGMDF